MSDTLIAIERGRLAELRDALRRAADALDEQIEALESYSEPRTILQLASALDAGLMRERDLRARLEGAADLSDELARRDEAMTRLQHDLDRTRQAFDLALAKRGP